jgi:hypothetical protein
MNLNELSSKTAKRGDTLAIVVQADVVVAGQVVIRQGTVVHGKVTEAKNAGLFGHGGELTISVDSLRAVDGQTVLLLADLRDTTAKAATAAGQGVKNQVATQATAQATQVASQAMDRVPGANMVTGAFHHGDDIIFKAHTLIPVFVASYVVVAVPGGSTPAPVLPVPASSGTGQPAAGDSTGTTGIAAASIAFFDAAHTWDRALGAMAAHWSTTAALRLFGLQIFREDSVLQAQGQAVATQFHTSVSPLNASDQAKLNQALLAFRNAHGAAFDQAVLQQLYDFENAFVSSVDTEDTATPMGKLLNQAAPVWKRHVTRAAQLLTEQKR